MNQIVTYAVSDGRERAHAARRDNHSERHKGATRDRCSLRTDTVILSCEALYVL